jgi:2,4-dienoyl-CoA reductase-like NADH-dependent reductase (Old Yellow Enzyme family)
MCQYTATDGKVGEFHFVHYGSRAIGGAGLIIAEATGVSLEGRISLGCTTIHTDEHIPGWKRITDFCKLQGVAVGIQIAHAGRKASCHRPWEGDHSLNDGDKWQTMAPSAIPFDDNKIKHLPKELTIEEIQTITQQFADAARRSIEAGFQVIELHFAHGYLAHEFYSPLVNKRTDHYGGSFENRIRFPVETIQAVRKVIPEDMPLFVRISSHEWHQEGFTIDDSVKMAKIFKEHGVDLIDCSGGFNVPNYSDIPFGPEFQVPFAEKIRKEADMATGAVGFITSAKQADDIVRQGKADLVIIGRQFLKNPYLPYHFAVDLGVDNAEPLCLPENYSYWITKKKQQSRAAAVESTDSNK